MDRSQRPYDVLDQLEIRDVLGRYCRAIDRLDLDLLGEVFHPDATIDNGRFRGGPAAFAAMVRERHARIPKASHMATTSLIDFIGERRAFVETYCLALEWHPHAPQGPVDRVTRVRYGDEFERRDGRWKIANRLVVIDHEMALPSAAEDGLWLAGRLLGLRSQEDPIRLRRRALQG